MLFSSSRHDMDALVFYVTKAALLPVLVWKRRRSPIELDKNTHFLHLFTRKQHSKPHGTLSVYDLFRKDLLVKLGYFPTSRATYLFWFLNDLGITGGSVGRRTRG